MGPLSETNRELENSIDHVIGTYVVLVTVTNGEVVVGTPKDPVVSVQVWWIGVKEYVDYDTR